VDFTVDEIIIGTGGDDVISATSGNNILIGGGGDDTYAWTLDVMGGGTDIVKDFSYDFAENSGDVLRFSDLLGGDQDSLNALLKLGTLSGNVFTADDGANSITLTFDSAKATLNVQAAEGQSQTIVLDGCDFTQQVNDTGSALALLNDIIRVGG
jgi:Ca2+-binding RTX toxin-like protein